MCNGIYPMEGRFNFLAGMYCEMAMEAYHTIIEQYDIILRKNSWVDSQDDQDKLEKALVSCVVFSAMSIESYLNNYAAACLGDSEFYDNFDKLSVIGKLELISKFILHAPLDKSCETYRCLKALLKERNFFIHNKSSRSEYQGSTKEEIEEKNKHIEECALYEEPEVDWIAIKEYLKEAENALKAVHGIATHFDKYDKSAYAEVHLFSPDHVYFLAPGQTNYRERAFKLLKIEVPQTPFI
ncbi:MAG: hypothetical protein IKB04_01185 [Clostridia bacterium]|nr:hypothetical protein [Clostridia bacterium]